MSNRQALEEPEEQVDLEGDDDDAGYGRRRGSRDDSEEPEEDDNDGRRDDYTGMEPEPAGGGKGGGDEEAGKGPDAANAGSEDERAKWDELLALPPHGSQVFIGGLPRDITEDDLRELCEPLGEIYEVSFTHEPILLFLTVRPSAWYYMHGWSCNARLSLCGESNLMAGEVDQGQGHQGEQGVCLCHLHRQGRGAACHRGCAGQGVQGSSY